MRWEAGTRPLVSTPWARSKGWMGVVVSLRRSRGRLVLMMGFGVIGRCLSG